ncbi:MAG TPA: hypothetical protein V6D12_23420 [Candidatus Obscuribacterales bacterium]
MDTHTIQPSRYKGIDVILDLLKRIGLAWGNLQAVWKVIEVLDEEDPSTW